MGGLKTKSVFGLLLGLAMLLIYAGPGLAARIPPDLAIDFHDGPSKVSPGQTNLNYFAQVSNKGGSTATVPDGAVVAKHTFTGTTSTSCFAATGYTCRGAGTATVEFVAVGDQTIGVGQSISTYAQANAPATGKITHTVTVDPDGDIAELDEGNNTDTITTYIGTPPATDLSVSQTDAPDPANVGAQVVYTVKVTNQGLDTAFNVVVDNALSANATYQFASSPSGRCNFIAPYNTAVCPLGNIPSGQSKELKVSVTPSSEGTISNTATVYSDYGDPEPNNDTVTEETTITSRSVPPGTAPPTGTAHLTGTAPLTGTNPPTATQPQKHKKHKERKKHKRERNHRHQGH